MKKGKRRRTITLMDSDYARLVAEQERQATILPSTPSISMVLHTVLERHLPEPEPEPKEAPKERIKKKFAKKARAALMAEPAIA